MGYYHQSSNRVARWYVFSSVCFFVNMATLEPFEISLRNFYRIWSEVRISSKMAAFQYAVAHGLWFNTSRSSFTSEQLWTRGRPNLAVVLTLTLKWLSARFWFRPTWLRLSFHCSHKWNLVSAFRRRLTTRLSAPSLKRLSLCNMTAVSSSVCQWPYTEHVQLISLSCVNPPRRSRTVVYLLQFVHIGYLDTLITSS